MLPKTKKGMIPKVIILAAVIGLFLYGCALSPSDDDDPIIKPPVTYNRSAPDSLILFLQNAYNEGDSAKYEECLDSMYVFELIPGGVEQDSIEWWDRVDELRIAGRMFDAWTNADGQRVNNISLSLTNIYKQQDNTSFGPDLPPPGETWWRVTASVDLRVEVENPQSPDGVTLFLVASDQEWIARPDPNEEGLWTIFRQYDKEGYN
ncbi:MAG: hypothetical protein JW958_02665 [Candidatus Eisenbacteria bacterium]|nr:hypothetical protein [Candidatus Eisenbacteria bacterium]